MGKRFWVNTRGKGPEGVVGERDGGSEIRRKSGLRIAKLMALSSRL